MQHPQGQCAASFGVVALIAQRAHGLVVRETCFYNTSLSVSRMSTVRVTGHPDSILSVTPTSHGTGGNQVYIKIYLKISSIRINFRYFASIWLTYR